ncbi:PIN domain-containing protein [Pelotomaculum propionicicum]|uniref:PIN domain-containing protein n=1 Tax=Pelotomaculum propionicicum TaxID=258475 RepID=UPI003B8158BB
MDYENVQDVIVDVINETFKVIIIMREDQTKVPIDLVNITQPLGNAVEWIRVNGKGRNALDFFIAFYLGKDVTANRDKTFIIYSKDTGYDPLLTHLKKSGIKARRIVSFQQLSQNKAIKIDEAGIMKLKDVLIKVPANKRPKKRNSLTSHITALFNSKPKQYIDNLIEDLFIKKIVYEENGTIKYSLDK